MTDDTQSKTYKVTLKAGTGFDEPWVTVEGDTEAELAFALKALVERGTFGLVGEASTALAQGVHGVQTAAQVLGGQVQQGFTPQQTQAVQQYQQSAAQQPQQWPDPATQGPPPDWAQAQQPQGNVVQGNFGQQQAQDNAGPRGQKLENDFVGKGGHYPPAGPRPSCLHGPRDWKSFTAKSGKLTEMWSCPFDRKGAFIPPGQTKCDVEWAN